MRSYSPRGSAGTTGNGPSPTSASSARSASGRITLSPLPERDTAGVVPVLGVGFVVDRRVVEQLREDLEDALNGEYRRLLKEDILDELRGDEGDATDGE